LTKTNTANITRLAPLGGLRTYNIVHKFIRKMNKKTL